MIMVGCCKVNCTCRTSTTVSSLEMMLTCLDTHNDGKVFFVRLLTRKPEMEAMNLRTSILET